MPPTAHDHPDAGLPSRSLRRSWLRDMVLLAAVAGLWFGSLLGIRPFSNPDEGRYAEIPREMALSGDFVTPRLNGVKYFEKPPLLYWLSALTYRVAGVNQFTARLWNALFAVAGVLATYAAARALYGRVAGWCAAGVLSTSVLWYGMSQVVLLDMAASVSMACAMFAFVIGMSQPPGRARRLLLLAFYAAMAVATLSKGLIGFLLPGAVAFWWTLLLNRWRTLRPFYPVSGILLFLAIAAPWHLLAARANKGFLDFYFIHEHFLRFTTKVHGREGPWWYFLAVLAVGLVPWVGFAWQAARHSLCGGWRTRQSHASEWFLLIWIVLIVAFFSASQSKLVPYILPVWPPLALLIGRFIAVAWQQRSAHSLRAGTIVVAAVAALIAVATILAPLPRSNTATQALMLPWRCLFVAALVLGGGTCVWFMKRDRPRALVVSIAITAAVLLSTFNSLATIYDRRSTKEFAALLKTVLKPNDRVYSVGFYPQDLPVYLGHLVHVVNYEGELAYGIDAEPDILTSRFLRDEAFARQWQQPGNAYVVIQRRYYEWRLSKAVPPQQILAQTPEFLLLTNQAPSSEP